jgi:hypothetical protein
LSYDFALNVLHKKEKCGVVTDCWLGPALVVTNICRLPEAETPAVRMAGVCCSRQSFVITNSPMAIAIAFNVLIYQFLEKLLIHSYAVRHDHARIAGHRLTHQAHSLSAKADVPLSQVLTDRVAETAPGEDLAQPGHRLQAACSPR